MTDPKDEPAAGQDAEPEEKAETQASGRYKTLADLPQTLPVFPLAGALVFAREILPLNVFEPRYVAMVDKALAGDRLIGVVQPLLGDDEVGRSEPRPGLHKVGTAARVVAFQETDEARYLISLKGIARFDLGVEQEVEDQPWRSFAASYDRFEFDLKPSADAGKIDRKHLLDVVRTYLERNNMDANWDVIHQTPDESLINYLCMVSPFGIRERQALLEAKSLIDRTDMMIALAEMLLAQSDPETDPPVH